MSVATTRRYRSTQTGELVSETEWHRVVAFDRTAEIIRDFLHKGNPVYVEGRIRTRKWQDQTGQERFTTEIVCETLQLLGGRDCDQQNAPRQTSGAPDRPAAPPDEDVPF